MSSPPPALVLASGSGLSYRARGGTRRRAGARRIDLIVLANRSKPSGSYVPVCDSTRGYAWIFPMGANGLNAGVSRLAQSAHRRFAPRWKICLRIAGRWAVSLCAAGLAPCGAARDRHQAGVVSCGDAGGLVDPTSGEGLTAALTSGKRAGMAKHPSWLENPEPLITIADGPGPGSSLRSVDREPDPRCLGWPRPGGAPFVCPLADRGGWEKRRQV